MQEITTGTVVQPIPFKIEYRKARATKRQSIKHSLEGTGDNLELVVFGSLFEQSTIAAALKEMELRFELEAADSKLTIPSVATAWGHSDEMHEDVGGEIAKFRDNAQSTKRVLFVVWSEPPRCYTYLRMRSIECQPRHAEFKDSSHGEFARTVATRMLPNLRLIEPHEEAPLKSNQKHQEDSWSCGLWACRWVERQLRENRGEVRMVPASFAEIRSRASELISKIKDVKGWARWTRPRQLPGRACARQL
jgi:hypothetical protein